MVVIAETIDNISDIVSSPFDIDLFYFKKSFQEFSNDTRIYKIALNILKIFAQTIILAITFPFKIISIVPLGLTKLFNRSHEHILKKLMRTCVFQFAVQKEGAVERFLLRRSKICLEGDMCHTNTIDIERLKKSETILKTLGGEIEFSIPKDKKAKIRHMLLSSDKMEKIIEDKGGHWKELCIEDKDELVTLSKKKDSKKVLAIYSDENSPTWLEFSKNTLNKMFWDKKTLIDENGKTREIFITNYHPELINDHYCFMHSHAPSVTIEMERKRISQHLGMKQDICIYDYRGVYQSEGSPSESGYYLDADSTLTYLKTKGYPLHKIWVTGFCGGAPVASYLKAKYHDKGINLSVENAFLEMIPDMIDNTPFPAKIIGNFAKDSILSKDEETRSLAKEDYFNTSKKFQSLSPSKEFPSKVIVLKIATDITVHPEASKKLIDIASKSSKTFFIQHIPNKKGDGHSLKPLEAKEVLEKYMQAIFDKKN